MASIKKYYKVITFSFLGGSRDGESIRSDCQLCMFEIAAYWC